MTDALNHGIVGSGLGGNTFEFCVSPNIGANSIIQWDLNCDGIIDQPVSTSGNCAVFNLSAGDTELCATIQQINPDGIICTVPLDICLPEVEPQGCSCDTFDDDVDAGFTWIESPPSSGTVNFTPNSLMNDCDSIFWAFGDGATATSLGNTVVTHTYTTTGLQYVCMIVTRVTPDSICQKEYCENIDLLVSTEEEKLSKNLMQIHPNPSFGSLNVLIPETFKKAAHHLQLRSIQGQLLKIIPVTSISLQVSIEELPAGIFLLYLNDEYGNLMTSPSKVVKQ